MGEFLTAIAPEAVGAVGEGMAAEGASGGGLAATPVATPDIQPSVLPQGWGVSPEKKESPEPEVQIPQQKADDPAPHLDEAASLFRSTSTSGESAFQPAFSQEDASSRRRIFAMSNQQE